jgi:hypothetical protein
MEGGEHPLLVDRQCLTPRRTEPCVTSHFHFGIRHRGAFRASRVRRRHHKGKTLRGRLIVGIVSALCPQVSASKGGGMALPPLRLLLRQRNSQPGSRRWLREPTPPRLGRRRMPVVSRASHCWRHFDR